ncbi:MAG: rhodanese-like domain-containing protein [Acetobacteraceae bacterium]|jgi:rhodanese-related sulfurtransferase|nr:rhodanese-like domain-containing protein [Acetobacteraceae bacterium]
MPSLPDPRDPAVTLADVERAIRALHPVPHLSPEQAEGMLAEGSAVVFDVRAEEEFDLGHLPGAVRVDPSLSAARLAAAHGLACAGRVALFVCSVGLRSGRMAERAASALGPFRPRGVANLSGGLFRWAAEGRRPALPGLHPFNEAWGALLARSLRAKGNGAQSSV